MGKDQNIILNFQVRTSYYMYFWGSINLLNQFTITHVLVEHTTFLNSIVNLQVHIIG